MHKAVLIAVSLLPSLWQLSWAGGNHSLHLELLWLYFCPRKVSCCSIVTLWYLHECTNSWWILFNVSQKLLMPVVESLLNHVNSGHCWHCWQMMFFCSWCLLEQEAARGMDIVGIKKIQLLIWEYAAKCTEVCTFVIALHAFHCYLVSVVIF